MKKLFGKMNSGSRRERLQSSAGGAEAHDWGGKGCFSDGDGQRCASGCTGAPVLHSAVLQ